MSALVPLGTSSSPARQPTLAEWVPRFLQWFKYIRKRAPSTVDNYGRDLKSFLAFAAHVPLIAPNEVRFQHIEIYLGLLQHERHASTRTANRHLSALRAFWRYLVREGAAAQNPAADVFSLPEASHMPARLSIPDQERVLARLATDATLTGRRDYALVATALLTGLRCEELATLRREDLDLAAGRLHAYGKGNKARELPVIPRLGAILRAYLDEVRAPLLNEVHTPWLFVRGDHVVVRRGGRRGRIRGWVKARAGQPLGRHTVWHLVQRAVSPIIRRPVHPHMLRHSYASRLRENGAPLELISEALGHADLRTTMVYAKISTIKRRQDIARFLDPEAPEQEGG